MPPDLDLRPHFYASLNTESIMTVPVNSVRSWSLLLTSNRISSPAFFCLPPSVLILTAPLPSPVLGNSTSSHLLSKVKSRLRALSWSACHDEQPHKSKCTSNSSNVHGGLLYVRQFHSPRFCHIERSRPCRFRRTLPPDYIFVQLDCQQSPNVSAPSTAPFINLLIH